MSIIFLEEVKWRLKMCKIENTTIQQGEQKAYMRYQIRTTYNHLLNY
jgi:hypothetical protein